MTDQPEAPKQFTWKGMVELVNTYKVLAAVLTALSVFIAWNNKQVTAGTMTVKEFDEWKKTVPTIDQMDSALGARFEERDAQLQQQGRVFVRDYVQPMMATDEQVTRDISGLTSTMRDVINAQNSVSKDMRVTLLERMKRDSIVEENARLKAEMRVTATVEEIMREIKKGQPTDPPKKRRKDKVE